MLNHQNAERQEICSHRLGEQYTKIQHPSGLTMLLYPMKDFSTSYAMFATKYGSVDLCFKTTKEAEFRQVPAGIAHYLEHKLFESEDGDAFARFAKTGASANAFTSFDRTAYLFACSDHFAESIEILLDFVTHPYFTKETVEKEQGIIGQEIRMYDDDPGWQVMTNLLQSLYVTHPIRLDIAGTVESIAEINAELLYQCYHTFYNLNNMVLTVAGNFQIEEVLAAADRILGTAPAVRVAYPAQAEPLEVCTKRAVKHLPVATPLFEIGFKSPDQGEVQNFKNMIMDEMLTELLAGETTDLYHALTQEGLINNGLSGETMQGRDYLATIFSGESKDPDQVYERICGEIVRMQEQGIQEEEFLRSKKASYGRYLGMFSRPEAIASVLVNTYFAGMEIYEMLELAAAVTREELELRLKEDFDPEHSAVSIVMQ